MKFQIKLILTYGAFLLLFILSLGIYLLRSNTRLLTEETSASYGRVGESVLQQLDFIFDQMDFILLDLLSREDFKSAVTTLEAFDRTDRDYEKYYNEASSILKSHLLTYSLQKKYHSIVYLNRKGDFFSSNIVEHQETRVPPPREGDFPWMTDAVSVKGTAFLISPYEDPRGTGKEEVFGYGRLIREDGTPYGYLLAQKNTGELESLFSVLKDEGISLLVSREDNRLFYGSRAFSPEEIAYYGSLERSEEVLVSPLSGKGERVLSFLSDRTGLKMIILIDRSLISGRIRQTRIIILLALFLLLIFSLLFDYISSRMLTKPLGQITEYMNRVELNSLPGNLNLDSSHDEIAELNGAFHELIKRLDESAKREIQMNTGWIQAKMDALQEQVNPHFLYNVLTVISQRAYVLGDNEICRTCDEIATMLRYSTSTASRYAVLSDELDHARNYLSLMKRRLGDDLEFSLDVEEELLSLKVPKIILQPLVENSLNHGFRDITGMRVISLRGYTRGEGWVMEVRDNGQGFRTEGLEEKTRKIREEMDRGTQTAGFQIGGMGLLNTYARLYLAFRDRLFWDVKSSEAEGTAILFGSQWQRGEK